MNTPAHPRRGVLVTGATGALGPAVIRAFTAEGWNVHTLSRTAPKPGTPAAAHPHTRAEIDDGAALARAMKGIDVVVHMAALLHVFEKSASLEHQYHRINVGGTAAVMAGAREAGVRRVVALSSIAVYGQQTGLIDETTRPVPDTPYGRSKLEAEQRVLETAGTAGPSGSVLRLAAVYGPSVKGNYERLVIGLARGRFVPVGAGLNRRTLVFEDDVARAVLLAASRPEAAAQIFNVTDGQIHTVRQIIAAISAGLGQRPPRLRVPARAARFAVATVEALCRVTGRPSPVPRWTLDKYLEDVAVSGERLCNTLGFQPQWSLQDGWAHTICELRREGRL